MNLFRFVFHPVLPSPFPRLNLPFQVQLRPLVNELRNVCVLAVEDDVMPLCRIDAVSASVGITLVRGEREVRDFPAALELPDFRVSARPANELDFVQCCHVYSFGLNVKLALVWDVFFTSSQMCGNLDFSLSVSTRSDEDAARLVIFPSGVSIEVRLCSSI